MQFIRSLNHIQEPIRCAITLGNFDGLHIGHQAIIQRMVSIAKQQNIASVVVIFEPQPQEFFQGDGAPARLTRLREKIALLRKMHIDYVLCLRFSQQLATLSAIDFVQQVLLKKFIISHLVVGDDFRFGHNREGDFTFLQKIGKNHQFQVEDSVTKFNEHHQRISSTLIRQALQQGNLETASRLLGRPYAMFGKVAHGHKRGRIIGFPTANIHLHRRVTPILGVYAVKVYGIGSRTYFGVANVGNRPTVNGTRTLLEAHMFDFDQEIYGETVRVDFIHKLRDEKRYESFEQLKQQIFRDATEARLFFGCR